MNASLAKFVLALDQGTTSSRAILFDRSGRAVGMAQREFPQILPQPDHVEHDPEQIWESQLGVARKVMADCHVLAEQVAAIGITNQRETTVVWDKESGRPVQNAIVWQSRITADICDRLIQEGVAPIVQQKTGLILDAYFSATKLQFILDQDIELRRRAERGELLFGTIETFLIWRLTGRHITDVSNASRTMLFNLHDLNWDDELLSIFRIPPAMLPEVVASSEVYGMAQAEWLGGEIPVAGAAGDQQAATFGQACFKTGDAKNTYGTGCFLLMNIGPRPQISGQRLLTTVGWKIDNQVTYCLEGSVFIAGAVVQWLRDGLGLIDQSADVETLAATVEDNGGVTFVPALVGLGAPHWDPHARGTILGITRGTTAAHLARAALESMAFQTKDVLQAMERDAGFALQSLKVDGGACVNDGLMQFQADLLGVHVQRPLVAETTALGAAYLAGLAVGFWEDTPAIESNWALDREFAPAMSIDERVAKYDRWCSAVERAKAWAQ